MVTERWEKRQYCINQGDWDFGKLDLYRCVCMCQCYARHMHMYKTIMFLFWFCHFPSCHVASVWIRLPELGMPAVLLKRANGLFRLRYCCSSVHTCRTKEVSWHMHFSKYITVWKHFIKDFLPAVPAFLIWEVLVDICLCVYDFFFFCWAVWLQMTLCVLCLHCWMLLHGLLSCVQRRKRYTCLLRGSCLTIWSPPSEPLIPLTQAWICHYCSHTKEVIAGKRVLVCTCIVKPDRQIAAAVRKFGFDLSDCHCWLVWNTCWIRVQIEAIHFISLYTQK